MIEIENTLKRFNIYELSEKEENNLMRRVDVKYVFHRAKLAEILENALNHYRRLNICDNLIPIYESIYFDTDDFHMYTAHHNGILNRYKIRKRSYVDTGNEFLEIKFKSNKKITRKVRIGRDKTDRLNNNHMNEFILKNSPFNPKDLKETVRTKFSRITLTDRYNSERITIDLNIELSFKNKTEKLGHIIICEVKKNKDLIKSNFEKLLSQYRIKPFRLSKYCLANYYLNNGVKHNLYKEKAIYLNKILNNNE